MEIIYEGVDIYPEITLKQCIYDSYAEQQADSLKLVFNDVDKLWDKWNPKDGDTVIVRDGDLRTGTMNVVSATPENGRMCIRANSVPKNYTNKSNKTWEAVKFYQICEEIAARHGLKCEFYSVTNQTYAYVSQQNKGDFDFLEERCVLEGCAFLVYDGRLIVYSESAIENGYSIKKMSIGNDVRFEYEDKSSEGYDKCIVKNGTVSGEYQISDGEKLLERELSVKISSKAEADRFAKNILRFTNKKMTKGVCYSNALMTEYAAGSLINIDTAGASSWNGNVFITHIRHDLVNKKSKIWFRKPLEDY